MSVPKQSLSDFADKDYRDGFLDAVTRSGIAYQIKALRRKFGFSQQEMATATGKTQSVVSRLEGNGRASVQTLLDIASALDVALLIRFVPYPEFLARANDMSESALQPETIQESLAAEARDQWLSQFMNPNAAPPAERIASARYASGEAHTQSALNAHNDAITRPERQRRPPLSLAQQSYSRETSYH